MKGLNLYTSRNLEHTQKSCHNFVRRKKFLSTHLAEISDVMGDLEVAERSSSLGMNHALRDPLPVEVSHLVQEDDILKKVSKKHIAEAVVSKS